MANRYWIEWVRDPYHTLKSAPVGYIANAEGEFTNADDEFFSADDELSSADDELPSADNEFFSTDDELSSADNEFFSTDDEYINADNDAAHTYKWAKNTPVPKNIFLFTRIFFRNFVKCKCYV